jgi:hypothetical protein
MEMLSSVAERRRSVHRRKITQQHRRTKTMNEEIKPTITESKAIDPASALLDRRLEAFERLSLELEALLPPRVSVTWDMDAEVVMMRHGRGADVKMSCEQTLQILAKARVIVDRLVSV